MIDDVLIALGGVGLFLLGIRMLTGGLRGLAGGMLRRLLARFTTNATTGAATGAVLTAIIQSSSATTVTAVGLVGAGFLTFPQALGIVLGANIGTTATGWIIAAIGFKLELGLIAMPLLVIGVVATMFAPGRWRQAGVGSASEQPALGDRQGAEQQTLRRTETWGAVLLNTRAGARPASGSALVLAVRQGPSPLVKSMRTPPSRSNAAKSYC